MPARQPFTALCRQLARGRYAGRADLHLHTTHSDGTYTPGQLVDLARRCGLSALAVTDHDTLGGVAPARAVAGGSGVEEPMLMAIEYSKGRVFHTTLGHDVGAMQCVGFIVTLQRGTEWAATGKVPQKVPDDFPAAKEVRTRKWGKKRSLAKTPRAQRKTEEGSPPQGLRRDRRAAARRDHVEGVAPEGCILARILPEVLHCGQHLGRRLLEGKPRLDGGTA
jgi:hypothetical protein